MSSPPSVLTLVSPDPAATEAAVRRLGAAVKASRPLGPGAIDLDLAHAEGLDAVLAGLPVDYCLQPVSNRRKRLLLADMDSTLVGCECLDELADFAGVKAQVAAVTERAMRGELAFEPALRERVARLKGLPLEAMTRCLRERVRLNPGADVLGHTLAAHGVLTVIVSGGFESFTEPVAAMAGFALNHGNRLLDDGAALTGEVAEPILGRDAKRAALQRHAESLGLSPADAAAIGDGANDLDMIRAAGLGVAYRAKPVVAAQAHARIDHADLTALLYFQGYEARAFVTE